MRLLAGYLAAAAPGSHKQRVCCLSESVQYLLPAMQDVLPTVQDLLPAVQDLLLSIVVCLQYAFAVAAIVDRPSIQIAFAVSRCRLPTSADRAGNGGQAGHAGDTDCQGGHRSASAARLARVVGQDRAVEGRITSGRREAGR